MFTPMSLAQSRPRLPCTATRRALVRACTRPFTRHGDIDSPSARQITRHGSIQYELVGTPRLPWQSSKSWTINALPDKFDDVASNSEGAPTAAGDSAQPTSRVAAANAATELLEKAGEGDDVIGAVRAGIFDRRVPLEVIEAMFLWPETQVVDVLKRLFAGDVAGGASGTGRIQLPARPQGPIGRNLDSVAGVLMASTRPGADDCEFYVQQGSHKFLYIDPGRQVQEQLQAWLDLRVSPPPPNKPPVPLVINGLIKCGKTCTLSTILPAVVRKHPQFGVGMNREVLVIHLSVDKYWVAGDLPAMLRNLFLDLMIQVVKLRIPFSKETWDVLQLSVNTSFMSGIHYLLSRLDANVLILLDEVQAWMLPGGHKEVDLRNAQNARAFFKNLLYESPDNILWAVTGSAMGTYWLSAALAPKNGVALVMHNRTVNLPASGNEQVMHCTWMALCKELGLDRTKDESLFTLSGRSPALLVHSVLQWHVAGRPQSISEFMAQLAGQKDLVETFNDLSIILQMINPELRKILYFVSHTGHGVEMRDLAQPPDLLSWLEPYLIPAAERDRKLCLGSAHHRQLFQLLIGPDGNLKCAEVPAFGSPTFWEAKNDLFELCNNIVAAMKGEFTSEHAKDLERLLQSWAKTVETRYGPANNWPEQDWFRRVQCSEYNAQKTANEFAALADSLEPWQMLQWYHRLLRNCLEHKELLSERLRLLPKIVKGRFNRSKKSKMAKGKGGKHPVTPKKTSQGVALGGQKPKFFAEDVDLLSKWPVALSVVEIATLITPIKNKWSPKQRIRGNGFRTVRMRAWQPSGPPLVNDVPVQWLALRGQLRVQFLDHASYIRMCGSS